MSETRTARMYAAALAIVASIALVLTVTGGADAATGPDRGVIADPTTTSSTSTTNPRGGISPTTTTTLPVTTTVVVTTTQGTTTTTSTTQPSTTTTSSSTTTTSTTIPGTTLPPRHPPGGDPPPPTSTTTTTSTTLPSDPEPTGDEQHFIDLINSVRAQAGAAPVVFNGQLADHARMWAAHLADTLFVEHSDLSPLVGPPWRHLGENIGFGPSPEWIIDWLTNSPIHYANMTNPDFTHVGVGSYFDYRGVVWSVHVFGEWWDGERPVRPR